MKTKHIVPLSIQAVTILRALWPFTCKGLNEQGWNRDAIERQASRVDQR